MGFLKVKDGGTYSPSFSVIVSVMIKVWVKFTAENVGYQVVELSSSASLL